METVSNNVIKYVQHIGCGTFGVDLFFGRVPNSNKTPVAIWWLMPKASYVAMHNPTGEDTLAYSFELSYRDTSIQKMDQELFRATKEIVGSHCYDLDDFTTMNIELISSVPRISVDNENRAYGTIEFKVTVYNILKPTTPISE